MDLFISFLYILLAIVILLMMIVIHEVGHYLAGKLLKFKINEFSVGFGPKIFSKTKANGEKFSLRVVPLGGYCAFEGENEDGTENPQSFNSQKPWKRIIVFLSGAAFNLVSAVIFSFIFILIIGYAAPTVDEVYRKDNLEPYNQIMVGDQIVAVNDQRINVLYSFEDLSGKISKDETATFTVIRGGEEIEITVKKQIITHTEGDYTGFGFASVYHYYEAGAGSAFLHSIPFTLKLSWKILGTFGKLVTGKIPITELAGPVGTISKIADLSHQNWRNILILLPFIASNLAVFNLLPIPALDGSKIVFTVVEWIRKKPLKREVENIIHFAGIIAIFGLVIIIDLISLFT